MKAAYLEDAEPAAVSEAAGELLKARGALVTERTHTHVRFEELNPNRSYSFAKGGYVGVYRHAGEKDVELRLRVDASFPARAFWWTVVGDLVAVVLLFVLNPPGSTWVAVGAFLYAAFLATLLIYLGTWRSTWRLERELMEALLLALRDRPHPPARILTEDDLELREFEEDLEGELTEQKLREARKTLETSSSPRASRAAPGKRLRSALKLPKRSRTPAVAPEETVEAKRARLAALRDEIERRKRGE